MFLMDWANSLLSCGVSIMLFLYLTHIKPETNWGPAGEARKYTSALRGLESLETNAQDHVKTFRPQLLFMSGNPQDRPSLLGFAVALRAARGAMVMGNVIVTEPEPVVAAAANGTDGTDGTDDGTDSTSVLVLDPIEEQIKKRKKLITQLTTSANVRDEMYKFIYNNEKVPELKTSGLMCEVVCAPDLLTGFVQILQLGGLGRLRPNTVCLGYKKDWKTCSNESAAMYESLVASSMANNSGVIIVRDPLNTFAIANLETSSTSATTTNNSNAVAQMTSIPEEKEIEMSATKGSSVDISADGGGVKVASVRSMSTATGIGKTFLGAKKKEKRIIDVYWLADVSFSFFLKLELYIFVFLYCIKHEAHRFCVLLFSFICFFFLIYNRMVD